MTDIGFYKYLEAAFRYRLLNPQGMTATLATRFNYLGYNLPFNRIFFYARRVLPKLYTSKFPDTEEGNLQMARQVLTDLDRRRNVELNKYFDPTTAPAENAPIIEEARTEQVISAPAAAAGPAPAPAIPPTSIPRAPRIIVPPATTTTTQTETASTQPTPVSTQPPPMPSPPIQVSRIPSPLINTVRNFGSNAQIFTKRNLGKIADGLKGIVGGVGRGLGGAASSGLGAATPSLGRAFHGGLNVVGRITQPGGAGGMPAGGFKSPVGRRFAIALLLAMFLFVFISGFLGGLTEPTSSLKAAPIPSSSILDYFIPFRNSDVRVANPDAIKAQVRNSWPNAQLQNWDIIVAESITRNWNPAFVLALWIEETGAQGVASYNDPLGCAPNQPTTDINISLACLFNNFSNFSNDQFSQFMAKYSGGPASAPFSNNPNFPKGIKDWYSKLVPSGPGAIQIISPTTVASDCPVPEGQISFSSYSSDTNTGHCGGNYSYTCRCGTSGRRAKAIDVLTNGQSVILPTINGQPVAWMLIVGPYQVDSQEGGGFGYTFQAVLGNDTWYLDMLHLNQSSSVMLGGNYPSGTPVATTAVEHVHMTIGKNLSRTPVAGSESDCDPGWMASDFMCQ